MLGQDFKNYGIQIQNKEIPRTGRNFCVSEVKDDCFLLEQLILKFIWNHRTPPNSQRNLDKEEQSRKHYTLPNFKPYSKAIAIRITWYQHKKKQINSWNRTKLLEINPNMYVQLILDKGAKSTQLGKESFFNKRYWDNWMVICKKIKLDPYFILFAKMN